MNSFKKGQSTIEYAVLIAAVVAGLVAMRIYIKRGISGRLRSQTDEVGSQFTTDSFTSQRVVTYGTTSEFASYDGSSTETTREVQQSAGRDSIPGFSKK